MKTDANNAFFGLSFIHTSTRDEQKCNVVLTKCRLEWRINFIRKMDHLRLILLKF